MSTPDALAAANAQIEQLQNENAALQLALDDHVARNLQLEEDLTVSTEEAESLRNILTSALNRLTAATEKIARLESSASATQPQSTPASSVQEAVASSASAAPAASAPPAPQTKKRSFWNVISDGAASIVSHVSDNASSVDTVAGSAKRFCGTINTTYADFMSTVQKFKVDSEVSGAAAGPIAAAVEPIVADTEVKATAVEASDSAVPAGGTPVPAEEATAGGTPAPAEEATAGADPAGGTPAGGTPAPAVEAPADGGASSELGGYSYNESDADEAKKVASNEVGVWLP